MQKCLGKLASPQPSKSKEVNLGHMNGIDQSSPFREAISGVRGSARLRGMDKSGGYVVLDVPAAAVEVLAAPCTAALVEGPAAAG